jgi:hypothetical protein
MKNIKLVATDNTAPSRLLEKHSDARLHLAGLINQKLRVEEKLRHLAESAQKLQDAQSAEQDAVSAINALNSAEAAAMTAWSQDPSSGPIPSPDIAKRDELLALQRKAQAQASAARQATTSIVAEQQREAARLTDFGVQIGLAVVPVAIEELEPLIAEFVEFNKKLAEKAGRIAAGAEMITTIANGVKNLELAGPAFRQLEVLNEQIRNAFARPAPDMSPHAARWAAYANALQRDPIARLEP